MDEILPADFLNQVFTAVQNFGGLPMLLKISAIITLLVASMKVSVLKKYVWNRLGAAQVWLAPLLGLIAGLLGLGAGDVPVTLPLIVAYVTAGTGAVFLHEILDSAKALPGVGPAYLAMIAIFEKFLGAQTTDRPRTIVQ